MADQLTAPLKEIGEWWQDVVDDLEPDTATFTLTMSRAMAERIRDAFCKVESMLSDPSEDIDALVDILIARHGGKHSARREFEITAWLLIAEWRKG